MFPLSSFRFFLQSLVSLKTTSIAHLFFLRKRSHTYYKSSPKVQITPNIYKITLRSLDHKQTSTARRTSRCHCFPTSAGLTLLMTSSKSSCTCPKNQRVAAAIVIGGPLNRSEVLGTRSRHCIRTPRSPNLVVLRRG